MDDPFPGRDRDSFDPGRGVREILLVKKLAVNSLRITDQGEGAVFEVGGKVRPDLDIVGHDIPFGVTLAGPEDFIQVFDGDRASVDDQFLREGGGQSQLLLIFGLFLVSVGRRFSSQGEVLLKR